MSFVLESAVESDDMIYAEGMMEATVFGRSCAQPVEFHSTRRISCEAATTSIWAMPKWTENIKGKEG